MSEEQAQSPARGQHIGTKPGFISGTGVVRDKFGNIKAHIVLSGPATPAEAAALKEAYPDKFKQE